MKKGNKIGAMVGGLSFLVVGIMPGIYFGGYGAISLLSKLSGGPIDSSLLNRVVVICGMAVGVVSMATTCLVVGGLIGAVVGVMVENVAVRSRALA